jgi:hypothetical protein
VDAIDAVGAAEAVQVIIEAIIEAIDRRPLLAEAKDLHICDTVSRK